ncbi:hypothetical protein [Pantoea dispersa]|uniref:hypothetical protein n=1 Tax=Pantoea dispersa TaxID=59814 RepID=UPI000B01CF18|nr:hypothetical protein [Pantoea dispersa]
MLQFYDNKERYKPANVGFRAFVPEKTARRLIKIAARRSTRHADACLLTAQ